MVSILHRVMKQVVVTKDFIEFDGWVFPLSYVSKSLLIWLQASFLRWAKEDDSEKPASYTAISSAPTTPPACGRGSEPSMVMPPYQKSAQSVAPVFHSGVSGREISAVNSFSNCSSSSASSIFVPSAVVM